MMDINININDVYSFGIILLFIYTPYARHLLKGGQELIIKKLRTRTWLIFLFSSPLSVFAYLMYSVFALS